MSERQSWAPGAFIFVLVMCLVYTASAAKRCHLREEQLEREVFTKATLLEHFAWPSRLIFPAGPQRIVPIEILHPRPHDDGPPVPVFSRESQFSGVAP